MRRQGAAPPWTIVTVADTCNVAAVARTSRVSMARKRQLDRQRGAYSSHSTLPPPPHNTTKTKKTTAQYCCNGATSHNQPSTSSTPPRALLCCTLRASTQSAYARAQPSSPGLPKARPVACLPAARQQQWPRPLQLPRQGRQAGSCPGHARDVSSLTEPPAPRRLTWQPTA